MAKDAKLSQAECDEIVRVMRRLRRIINPHAVGMTKKRRRNLAMSRACKTNTTSSA